MSFLVKVPFLTTAVPTWSDLFTQEVYDDYNNIFNDETNYTNKVYIDPDYTGGDSDGTIEKPFLTIRDAPLSQNDTAYLVKRGTYHIYGFEHISYDNCNINGSNVMLGAYGEGDPPHLDSTNRHLNFRGPNFLVRDVKIASLVLGQYNNPTAKNGIVFNTDIRAVTVWSLNHKFIGCHFGPAGRNSFFCQMVGDVLAEGPNYIEVGYSLFEKANQVWLPDGKPETEASGDAFMLSNYAGTWHIHHSILDRSDTGNKFCIIVNPHTNGDRPVNGIIENCYLEGPRMHPDGGACILLGNIVVNNGSATNRHEIIIRNNIIQGTYCDIANTWTGAGIYANSAYMEVYGNIIKKTNYAARTGSSQSIVYNNTFVDMKNTNASILSLNTAKLYNNIFDRQHHASGTDSANNIYLDQIGTEPDDVFINPATEDYRLKANGPAVGASIWESWMDSDWTQDLLGNNIPQS